MLLCQFDLLKFVDEGLQGSREGGDADFLAISLDGADVFGFEGNAHLLCHVSVL